MSGPTASEVATELLAQVDAIEAAASADFEAALDGNYRAAEAAIIAQHAHATAGQNGLGREPIDSLSRVIDAQTLTSKRFPEPRYAIPGIVPEGATLLVGAPKRGKSWLLLGLGVAVAAGGYALGKIPVEQGEVLLLCLEDSERRLQERLWRILDGADAPSGLHLVTEWPRLDEGGDAALDEWLDAHPKTRLVGVDVLARLRPPSRERGDIYQRDYETMAAFKRVADRHSVALVVVHHSRKASADDPMDMISGSNGLGGAADTALILKREAGRADASLYVRGRDVPEADYALGFDPVICHWTLLGDAKEFRLREGRTSVLDLLRARGPLGPKEIAEALEMSRGNARVLLHRMNQAGQVVAANGIYSAPLFIGVTGVTPRENGAVEPNLPVTGGVTSPGTVTGTVTGEIPAVEPNSRPVTPVTARDGDGHEPDAVAPPGCGHPAACLKLGPCHVFERDGRCWAEGQAL